LKIGQHLAKLIARVHSSIFLTHGGQNFLIHHVGLVVGPVEVASGLVDGVAKFCFRVDIDLPYIPFSWIYKSNLCT